MFMKKFYLCRRRLDQPRPHFPRRRRGHRPPSTMPPHGSAKKKKKGRDGTGKKKSRGAHHDHGRASSGVGGGSSLENLIDSCNEHPQNRNESHLFKNEIHTMMKKSGITKIKCYNPKRTIRS